MITEQNLMGDWTATRETGPLPHGSNFSNWLEVYNTTGYVLLNFGVQKDQTIMQVGLPVAGRVEDETSHISIYNGRLEIGQTELLIWQNPNVPVRIPYTFINDVLKLTLFGTEIDFTKD